jgi:hypothetical protein
MAKAAAVACWNYYHYFRLEQVDTWKLNFDIGLQGSICLHENSCSTAELTVYSYP